MAQYSIGNVNSFDLVNDLGGQPKFNPAPGLVAICVQ